jgi:hypothetical protein
MMCWQTHSKLTQVHIPAQTPNFALKVERGKCHRQGFRGGSKEEKDFVRSHGRLVRGTYGRFRNNPAISQHDHAPLAKKGSDFMADNRMKSSCSAAVGMNDAK